MTVDSTVLKAIEEAVRQEQQPEALAKRIAAWFRELASGNETLTDRENVSRRLDSLFDAVVPSESEDERAGEG